MIMFGGQTALCLVISSFKVKAASLTTEPLSFSTLFHLFSQLVMSSFPIVNLDILSSYPACQSV